MREGRVWASTGLTTREIGATPTGHIEVFLGRHPGPFIPEKISNSEDTGPREGEGHPGFQGRTYPRVPPVTHFPARRSTGPQLVCVGGTVLNCKEDVPSSQRVFRDLSRVPGGLSLVWVGLPSGRRRRLRLSCDPSSPWRRPRLLSPSGRLGQAGVGGRAKALREGYL